MTEEVKFEKVKLKFEDFYSSQTATDFLDAVDKELEKGNTVTAIIRKQDWITNSHLQRWLLRKDLKRIVITE